MSEQRVCRPVASTDHTAGPLAALIKALSSGTHQGGQFTSNKDERFTAQLCSALNLQSNSLYANMQRGRAAASPKEPAAKAENQAAESSGACSQEHFDASRGKEAAPGGNAEPESSNEGGNGMSCLLRQPLTTEDAKKKRRQEINRESARRVRKRKTEAQQQLQEEVIALKSAASSTSADQAVVVRYASEVTKERDALLQHSAGLEAKWLTAECKNVILRQRIADILGVSLQQVAPDTGQILPPEKSQDPAAESKAAISNAMQAPLLGSVPLLSGTTNPGMMLPASMTPGSSLCLPGLGGLQGLLPLMNTGAQAVSFKAPQGPKA